MCKHALPPKTVATMLASLLLAFGLPEESVAQSDGVQRVIPYNGYLTDAGEVIDGSLAMRFSLYNSDDERIWFSEYSDAASRSCQLESSCLVPFYRGVFAVLLGQYASVEHVLTGGTTHVEAEEAATGGYSAAPYWVLNGNGNKVTMTVNPSVEGTYTLAVRAFEDHKSPDFAILEVRHEGEAVATIEVDAPSAAQAEIYTVDLTLAPSGSDQTIEIVFLNDACCAGGDRNVRVDWLQLSGGYPDEVQLGMEVRDEGGTWIPLEGRQRLVPEPYSLWAAQGTDFTVSGDLSVGGLAVSGILLAEGGTISVSGPVTASGNISSPQLTANLVTANSTIWATNNARAGDKVNVTGPVCFDSCDAEGGRVLVHDTGNTLTLNDEGDFAGGVIVDGAAAVNGAFQTDGDVWLHGDLLTTGGLWTIDGDRPWIATGSMTMGDDANIAFNTNDWFCFIGGYRFGAGDIDEGDVPFIMELHTYESGGDWHVRMEFYSHSDEHESHRVSYMCIQRGMVNVESWSF